MNSTTPSSADSVSILREAAAKARIGLRDWEIPQRRYDAIEAIDAALAATERAAIQTAGEDGFIEDEFLNWLNMQNPASDMWASLLHAGAHDADKGALERAITPFINAVESKYRSLATPAATSVTSAQGDVQRELDLYKTVFGALPDGWEFEPSEQPTVAAGQSIADDAEFQILYQEAFFAEHEWRMGEEINSSLSERAYKKLVAYIDARSPVSGQGKSAAHIEVENAWNQLMDALGCDDTDSALRKIAELAVQGKASDAEDGARLMFAMQDIDGFGKLVMDKYDYAIQVAEEAGRDVPTPADELEGIRRLIDAARAQQQGADT